ncbi:hypothetical protein CAPTEDRAFT_191232 [Capitella teleta]|uniref:Apple domain-containing protein n=1 Tax=Capitella teleta TaxID=283909 RepID=R7TF42_CAPTE|nr:hypothetical protein CAPTEDRAFT_191232 [Capitella teleta]|eukprot:ELT92354.1 hypothetical protein CAPTEDRAFT_191232 [Capitella teleta]
MTSNFFIGFCHRECKLSINIGSDSNGLHGGFLSNRKANATGPNVIKDCKVECEKLTNCRGIQISFSDMTCRVQTTNPNVYDFCQNKPNCHFNYPCSRETAECAVYEMGEMKMCFLSEEPFPWLKD